ncbi:MAG: divalent-cation tolerance protein CutA [Deltaproteobacteria bacterium]|nr:divalent-cation tolerance protein CutA [Deltaproteobacteria bacterium]
MSDQILCVLATAPVQEAPQLARALVTERLAACVNMLPAVRSIYRWQGEICDDQEALLLIKTTAERFAALRDRLVELHSYDVPEVIALPVQGGNAPYLSWVRESCSAAGDEP